MSAKAVFFGFGFRHHGPRTAFGGLKSALADQLVVDVSPPWPRWTPHAIEWRLNWRWLRASEYALLPYYRRGSRRVIHYFFSENTMFRAHRWKSTQRIVATCHQPIERFHARKQERDPVFMRYLASLDACDRIVVQCESHLAAYRDFLPDASFEAIPLGIDAAFFRRRAPYRGAAERPRILTVGNWLRDYAAWAATVRALRERGLDIDYVVVANPDTLAAARSHLGSCSARVAYLTGISDEALRDEYERAAVFFLPLTSAMANDALLEALAMGAPTVVTDLPATREYAGESASYIPAGDAGAAADAIAALLERPDLGARMSDALRRRAEERYAWPIIADHYRRLYANLA